MFDCVDSFHLTFIAKFSTSSSSSGAELSLFPADPTIPIHHVVIMYLWEHYRWICSAPEWSTADSKISQYVGICSAPQWSTTDSNITQCVTICTAPGWSTTDSGIPPYNCKSDKKSPGNWFLGQLIQYQTFTK